MKKEINILKNYLLYFLVFVLICMIGITGVFADTNINMSTWTNVTGRKWSSNSYESSSDIISDIDTIRAYYNVSAPIYTPPNSYEYVDFLYFQNSSGSNFNPCNGDDFKTNFYLKFSTPSFVNYVSRVRFSYHSDTGLDSCIISSRNTSTGMVDVSCSTHYETGAGGLVIWVDFNRNIPDTQNSWLYIQKNFPLSCMTNSQAIINNQNQNTQNIINNNNQNTQNIIDNNTENTQKIIDENKKNFETCSDSYNLLQVPYTILTSSTTSNGVTITLNDDYSITLNGKATSNFQLNLTHVNNLPNLVTSLQSDNNYSIPKCANGYCLIANKVGGRILNFNNSNRLISMWVPVNTTFNNETLKFMIVKEEYENSPYISPLEQVCTNKLDENKKAIDDVNDTLNDDSVSSSDDTLSNLQDELPTNSVISDLLLLPVRLLQALVNSLGGTCSSFNLGSLYGTNLIMPCINIESYLGSSIWTFIDLVFSGMFVLVIRKKFIQIWENITNLRNGGNEVD